MVIQDWRATRYKISPAVIASRKAITQHAMEAKVAKPGPLEQTVGKIEIDNRGSSCLR